MWTYQASMTVVCTIVFGAAAPAAFASQPTTSRSWSDSQLRGAQQLVLNARVRALRGELEVREGSESPADWEIARALGRGMPAEAFPPAALEAMARQEVVSRIGDMGGSVAPKLVMEACGRYGLDPETLFDLVPSTYEDLPATFRQYCEATDVATRPRLAHTLKSSRASRAQLEALIEIAEKDGSEACRSALLAVLANDWSRRGRDYLYKMANAATDHNRRMEILKVLLDRRQFSLVPHRAMMDQTTDPAVLDRLAEIAEKAAMIGGDMEARQFILSELSAAQPRRRELAVNIIAWHDRTVRYAMRDQMLQAVRQETDAPTRAAMVKSLVHIRMDNVNEFLFDIVENDKALDVRIAAVETMSMVSGTPATGQMIGRLQALVDEDAPEALKTALADKLAKVERAREKREQRKAERLKRMEDKAAPADE